jgi:drug/metabolite transporter (DMT)-like permease
LRHLLERAPRSSVTAAAAAAALLGFAANSLLTRAALGAGLIDPASYTVVRLASGALTLAILLRLSGAQRMPSRKALAPSLALFAYAAAFSYAYVRIGAGVGALILFGCVQLTMIGWGLLRGERPQPLEWIGLAIASAGLVVLQAPGVTAPDPIGAGLMAMAGVSWAVYTLIGRGVDDPLGATARNFTMSVPCAVLLGVGALGSLSATVAGAGYAIASGALASGVGYALWYRALPSMTALQAAIAQLVVPVIAAAGAVILLGEALSIRVIAAGTMILVGIGLTRIQRF